MGIACCKLWKMQHVFIFLKKYPSWFVETLFSQSRAFLAKAVEKYCWREEGGKGPVTLAQLYYKCLTSQRLATKTIFRVFAPPCNKLDGSRMWGVHLCFQWNLATGHHNLLFGGIWIIMNWFECHSVPDAPKNHFDHFDKLRQVSGQRLETWCGAGEGQQGIQRIQD